MRWYSIAGLTACFSMNPASRMEFYYSRVDYVFKWFDRFNASILFKQGRFYYTVIRLSNMNLCKITFVLSGKCVEYIGLNVASLNSWSIVQQLISRWRSIIVGLISLAGYYYLSLNWSFFFFCLSASSNAIKLFLTAQSIYKANICQTVCLHCG